MRRNQEAIPTHGEAVQFPSLEQHLKLGCISATERWHYLVANSPACLTMCPEQAETKNCSTPLGR